MAKIPLVVERSLVKLDEGRWQAISRTAIGSALVPLWTILCRTAGIETDASMLLIFFVSALLSLRVLPLIARRALPFSSEVRGVWAARRVLAKEHDSYQWMKLLWVGIGLTLYVLSTEDQRVSVLVLTTAALLAGGAGMVAWQRNTR